MLIYLEHSIPQSYLRNLDLLHVSPLCLSGNHHETSGLSKPVWESRVTSHVTASIHARFSGTVQTVPFIVVTLLSLSIVKV